MRRIPGGQAELIASIISEAYSARVKSREACAEAVIKLGITEELASRAQVEYLAASDATSRSAAEQRMEFAERYASDARRAAKDAQEYADRALAANRDAYLANKQAQQLRKVIWQQAKPSATSHAMASADLSRAKVKIANTTLKVDMARFRYEKAIDRLHAALCLDGTAGNDSVNDATRCLITNRNTLTQLSERLDKESRLVIQLAERVALAAESSKAAYRPIQELRYVSFALGGAEQEASAAAMAASEADRLATKAASIPSTSTPPKVKGAEARFMTRIASTIVLAAFTYLVLSNYTKPAESSATPSGTVSRFVLFRMDPEKSYLWLAAAIALLVAIAVAGPLTRDIGSEEGDPELQLLLRRILSYSSVAGAVGSVVVCVAGIVQGFIQPDFEGSVSEGTRTLIVAAPLAILAAFILMGSTALSLTLGVVPSIFEESQEFVSPERLRRIIERFSALRKLPLWGWGMEVLTVSLTAIYVCGYSVVRGYGIQPVGALISVWIVLSVASCALNSVWAAICFVWIKRIYIQSRGLGFGYFSISALAILGLIILLVPLLPPDGLGWYYEGLVLGTLAFAIATTFGPTQDRSVRPWLRLSERFGTRASIARKLQNEYGGVLGIHRKVY